MAVETSGNFVEVENKVYEIKNLAGLMEFRDMVNSGNSFAGCTVRLGADIDLNGSEENQWIPIGTSGDYSFNGNFDGQGYTISNLYINTPSASNVGFFGFTQEGSVSNLKFNNAVLTGRLYVGVVAGTPYTSKYSNIEITGLVQVNGMAYVGGAAGKNAYADWTDITINVAEGSYVKANSVENGSAYRTYVGGVIGFMGEGAHTVSNVYSNINVEGSTCDVGGIVGIAHYNNKFENITMDAAKVVCTDDSTEVGAIAGVWHNEAGTTVTMTNITVAKDLTVSMVKDGETVVLSGAEAINGSSYNAASAISGTLVVGNEVKDADGKVIGMEFLQVEGSQADTVLAKYPVKVGSVSYVDVTAAMDAAQANGGATIDLGTMSRPASAPAASNHTVSANGTYKFINGNFADLAYGFVTPEGNAEANKDVDVNLVFDKANVIAGKFRLDNGSTLTITDSHMDGRSYIDDSRFWVTFYGDSKITINNSVVGLGNSTGVVAGSSAAVGKWET